MNCAVIDVDLISKFFIQFELAALLVKYLGHQKILVLLLSTLGNLLAIGFVLMQSIIRI